MTKNLDFEAWTCPAPLRNNKTIVTGHGGGGKLSAELIEALFLPAFGSSNNEMHDSTVINANGTHIAFSTDSYVVNPIFFPGGNIGDLAVNGTVNDLAMSGAQPLALSTGFILEEGLELSALGVIAETMGKAAQVANVQLATGDTKVIETSSKAPGLYINTAGIGIVPEGVDIRPSRAQEGDVIVVSGEIGLHGIAVMSKREGLEFGTEIKSDSCSLNGLVQTILGACTDIHVLRDPTRGGLTATLCEIASSAKVGIQYEEALIPVPAEVAAACSFLGLDPMSVANEGKLVAFIPPNAIDEVMSAFHSHEFGRDAVVIGRVTSEHPGIVTAITRLGATRIVDLPLGEQLPRIC